MEFTASQIASFIEGEILGDPSALITGVSPIERGEKGHMSFIAQEKFAPHLKTSECSVLIVSKSLLKENEKYPSTIIAVENAYLSFQVLMHMYQEMKGRKKGIEPHTSIDASAVLGEDVYVGSFSYISKNSKIGEGSQIYPQVYIGQNVKIGKNCQIFSGVRIYDYCVIGDNCTIHANTVIGSDGFGFQPMEKGYSKIPQLGNVVIENDVEIGSNCTIDRGTIGSTIIGEGTKIDNLIQIAHNVVVGKHNVIAAQAGIAGSTTIGDWNMIGGQVGVAGHITLGSKVRIQAQAGVNASVKDGETLYGSPAFEAGNFRRSYIHFKNLSQLVERINKLEQNSKESSNE